MNLETLLVLIETYWNVNVGPAGAKGEQGEVLIETYWNVNLKRE